MRLHQHDCPWCDWKSEPAREATSRWSLRRHQLLAHPERLRADLLYRTAIFRGRTPDHAARVYARACRLFAAVR